jgi:hypothetical protein
MPAPANPPAPDPIYFLLHIPKTAGQTIRQHFNEHCAPGVFWQTRGKLRARSTRPGQLPDVARARIIAGHYINRSLEDLFPGREIRRVLLLRDPLQLQISYYNWRMMEHLGKGIPTYSFDLYLNALPRNFISHFLLARWLETPWAQLMAMSDKEKYRLLNQMLAGFWFVGAHTDCQRLIARIGPEVGAPPAAVTRNTSRELQGRTGWRLVTEEALSPRIREAFLVQHRLDQALWREWRGAGFDTGAVRPQPLSYTGSSGFLAHEIVRPWYLLRRVTTRYTAIFRRGVAASGTLLERGDRARDDGRWEDAAGYYHRALQMVPEAWAIWVQYGNTLKESGRLADAEQAYRRALSLRPDAADTYLQLGHVLKLQSRLGQARAAYLRSATLDPQRAAAQDELIRLGATAHRVEEAASAMQMTPEGPICNERPNRSENSSQYFVINA